MSIDPYAAMTRDDFVRILGQVMDKGPASALLGIEGVYEAVSEEFNNEVLDRWEAEQGTTPPPPPADPTLQVDGTTVFQMLDISTMAVSKETGDWIQEQIDADANGGPTSTPVMYNKGDYGWFVHVNPELVGCDDLAAVKQELYRDDVPDDFLTVLLWAANHGFQWVMFDCDGGQVPDGLPTFEW